MKFARATTEKINQFRRDGWSIVIGNDWQKDRRPKWKNHELVRIAQTNSKKHGKPLRVVWAMRRKGGA